MTEEFRREVQFEPGYDKRNAEPTKNYGIHGVTIRFLLHGERGVVQFVIYTDWFPPTVEKMKVVSDCYPMAADLGYHSPVAHYEGQASMKCTLLPGHERCYCDGSGLNAEPLLAALIGGGSDAVWKKLEDYHRQIFA